jgi:hypothetical protein
VNHGDSIRRVAQMLEVAYSLLQRAIQAGGETKTRSQAYDNDMALTIAEEEAQLLKTESTYVLLGISNTDWHTAEYGRVCAIVEDRQRRNLECASDFFLRTHHCG